MSIFSRRKKQEAKFEKREKKNKMKWFSNRKGFNDVSGYRENLTDTFGACIDFTLLDPRTTKGDIDELLSIAFKKKYYSVVVPPMFVSYAKKISIEKYSGSIKIGSVVGFPLGNIPLKAKIYETKQLINDGADEIEVMINLSLVKMGDFASIRAELNRISKICRKRTLKIIIENAYLTDAEIEKLVKIIIKSKADYIMTSTGYAPIGATIELIEKLYSLASDKIGIKASGGVKTRLEAESFIRLGASRIGTSRIL